MHRGIYQYQTDDPGGQNILKEINCFWIISATISDKILSPLTFI